jgi:CMP-N,N'-diacetyllegionaminic acid synthase
MISMFKDSLFLITARGGSKGVPGKNIKLLHGKPLLNYTIEVARKLVPDEQICLSTDSDEIINVAKSVGLKVLFKRPKELALDTTGSNEVIKHAINFYSELNKEFKNIILLQPTSPFRTSEDIENAFKIFNYELDMVVSVNKSRKDPFYNLFEESKSGYLVKTTRDNFIRRQDAPNYYEYNGAIYVINIMSILNADMDQFIAIRKYIMDPLNSVDIDTYEDWLWAEFLFMQKLDKSLK